MDKRNKNKDSRKINRKTLTIRLEKRPSWKGYELINKGTITPKNNKNNKKNNVGAAAAVQASLPPPPFESVALGPAPAGMPSFQRSMAFHGNNNSLPMGFIPLSQTEASQGAYYANNNSVLPNAPPLGRSRRNRRTRRNNRKSRRT